VPAVQTIAGIVRHKAATRGGEIAIVFGNQHISWATLHNRAARVASGLMAAGVGAQQHVAFLDKNGLELFDWQFGCAMLNAINVSVNWRLAPAEMEFTINDACARMLVVGPEFFGHIEQIESRLTTVTRILAIGHHPRWESFEAWLDRHVPVDPQVPSSPADIAGQFYTSGTTGLPKGVMLTNSNMLALFEKVAPRWDMREGAVNLISLPLFHTGGTVWALAGMFHGCKTVIAREFVPQEILDTMVEHGVTTTFFVPAMLALLCQVPGAAERSYPIRKIMYGGSPITENTLLAAMATFKCAFAQIYGMTETSGTIAQLEYEDHDPNGPRAHLLRSAGKSFPWVECRIVDPVSGRDCAAGEVGELWTRSVQNMKGYWGKAEETASTITADGWLKTGDGGYLDEDGYLFLTDRVKDMIVSGGENIYPAEVENALAGHPAVAEVAVIGVPSDRWGETVKAIVVVKPGWAVTDGDLIAHARKRLAGYKCPTSVDFMDALPRNPSGKVLKKNLREPFWAGKERHIN